jgi:hypothetical protein
MLSFCFEHTLRARSAADVLAAYFDPDLVAIQDRHLDIPHREILELDDDGPEVRRVCRVVPRRQIPAIVRPFVAGPLHYLEVATWRKGAGEISIETRPSILAGRASISVRYRLAERAPGQIHRRYEGNVSVDVTLLSSRIERGIVAELERSVPVAAACTQAWLDRTSPASPAIPATPATSSSRA